jgi:hypothetical protein
VVSRPSLADVPVAHLVTLPSRALQFGMEEVSL